MYASFDCNSLCDVGGMFLDISKAFDRVWHREFIYTIKHFCFTVLPLKLIQSFLSYRFQGVVLSGQLSEWPSVTNRVIQGSILKHLIFLIHINDLRNNPSSTAKRFAGDTSLFSVVNNINLPEFQLNSDFKKTSG